MDDISKMRSLIEAIIVGFELDICDMNLGIPLNNYFDQFNSVIFTNGFSAGGVVNTVDAEKTYKQTVDVKLLSSAGLYYNFVPFNKDGKEISQSVDKGSSVC